MRGGTALLLTVGLHALAATARADESPEVARESARRQMDLGHARFEAQDFAAALEAYRAADALMNVPTTKLGVARALASLGRFVEAKSVLEQVAKLPAAPGEPAPFVRAREDAGALYSEVSEKTATLKVTVTAPAEAKPLLRIDASEVSLAEARDGRTLDPGEHRVFVQAPGFLPHEENLVLRPRDTRDLAVALRPDGGSEFLGLSLRGWSWVGVGVGAAAVVTGSVTGGLALYKMGRLDDACPQKRCGAAERSLYDEMNALANTSNVLLPLGLVALGAGVTGLVLLPDASASIAVGPRGFSLEGRF